MLFRWSTFVLVLSAVHAGADPVRAPKHVIVMIADGWGFNQIEATDYYQHGETGKQVYQRDFTHYAMSTYPATGGYDPAVAWGEFDAIKKGATDSAAAATTLATGVKTLNGAIGMDKANKPVENVVEIAEKAGKATGVVTSVQWSHATPAAFVVHDRSRGNYAVIARAMLNDSGCEVIMGAGHPWYGNEGELVLTKDANGVETTPNSYRFVGDETLWRGCVAGTVGGDCDGDQKPDPWTLIQTKEQFEALVSGDTPKRVLGVVQIAETLQQSRKGVDDDLRDDAPYQAPHITTVPKLAQMVLGALNVLDNDPDGFFLMIEGGAVDWACHDNQGGRMIEEMIAYNEAVEAVTGWVEKHSSWDDTLVIVTGDHECGYLLGPGSNPDRKPIVNNGKGQMPGLEFHHKSHTNQLIPCFVKGAGAERFAALNKGKDPVRGAYIDNADVGRLVVELVRGK